MNLLGTRQTAREVTLTAEQIQVGDVIFHEELANSMYPSAWRKVATVAPSNGNIEIRLDGDRARSHKPYAPIQVQVLEVSHPRCTH